jgi:hypothetical protein
LHFSFLAITEWSVDELSTYSRIEFSPTLIALCSPQVLFLVFNTVPTYVHTTDVWHFFAQYLFILENKVWQFQTEFSRISTIQG